MGILGFGNKGTQTLSVTHNTELYGPYETRSYTIPNGPWNDNGNHIPHDTEWLIAFIEKQLGLPKNSVTILGFTK